MPVSRADWLTSSAASAARGWLGRTPAPRRGPPPTPQLRLYEYEASPWCRRVRETLCVLGLDVLVLPCPRETLRLEGAFSSSSRFRVEAAERLAASTAVGAGSVTSRLAFPLLVDETAGKTILGSAANVSHLWNTYGQNVSERPRLDAIFNGGHLPKRVDFALLVLPSACRPLPEHGLMLAPSRIPAQPLVLHGCESEPGSRLVRERLCTLGLPYFQRQRSVEAPLPHLEDPNTAFATFGAFQALRYLDEQYRLGDARGFRAPVPADNVGDKDRTSWLSRIFPPSRL